MALDLPLISEEGKMADEGLFGVPMSFSPRDTFTGSLAAGLGAGTGQMITPYTSTGAAAGIGLGSILLQSLLGYQARQQAAERTLELNRLSSSLLSMQTPQERADYIGTLGDVDPLVLGRLGSLSGALAAQDIQQQRALDLERSKKMLGYQLGLSPEAQKLADLEQEREIAKIEARNAALLGGLRGTSAATSMLSPEQAEQQLLQEKENKLMGMSARDKIANATGSLAVLSDIANEFNSLGLTAVEYQAQRQIPGSAADLAEARLKANLSSTVRLLGEMGVLTDKDIERIQQALAGSLTSGTQTIARKIEQVVRDSNIKLNSQISSYQKLAKQGIEGLRPLQEPTPTATPTAETDKAAQLRAIQEQNAALMQRLNELKAARGL